MLEADRIKHKALRRYFETGETRGLPPEYLGKIRRILRSLDVITDPTDLRSIHDYHAHELKGDRAGQWSVTVRANWRITFSWDEAGPYDVNFENYH